MTTIEIFNKFKNLLLSTYGTTDSREKMEIYIRTSVTGDPYLMENGKLYLRLADKFFEHNNKSKVIYEELGDFYFKEDKINAVVKYKKEFIYSELYKLKTKISKIFMERKEEILEFIENNA